MSEANEITANLLIKIPERFPNIRVWRNNRVKAMAMGRGGKMRMISAGIDGQADISGIAGPTGRKIEIEVKAGNDKLSEDQIKFRNMILAHGGIYVEARSAEQGLRSLEQSLQSEELNGVHGLQSVAEIVNAAGGIEGLFEKARAEEKAKDRRDRELRALAEAGVPVKFVGKHRRQVGSLVIWQAAGRWNNQATGQSGRLNNISMRELVEREVSA